MRKLLAILLSAVMLMPEVYAEPLVNNNVSSENEGTEIIDGGVITEDPISEVVTDTEEDETPVTEDTENAAPVVTTPAEETSDETVTEEQNTPVLLADEGVQSRTVTYLSLAEAKNYTVKYTDTSGNLSDKQVIEITNEQNIKVAGSAGLILLSNVNPQDYFDKKINLSSTEGIYNLTGTQTYTKQDATTTDLQFLGLGNESYSYKGTITFANDGNAPFQTVSALFNCISTSAFISENLSFQFVNDYKISDKPLLAEKVIYENGDNILKCSLTLKVPNDNQDNPLTSATIGGIVGELGDNASANITLSNELEVPLIVSGNGNRGLFCNTMNNSSSLTAHISKDGSEGKIEVSVPSASNTVIGGNYGGFVGYMGTNTNLTIKANSFVPKHIKTNHGNAGGIVGEACDSNITIEAVTITAEDNTQTTVSSLDLSGLTVETEGEYSSGGLVGKNTNYQVPNLDLSSYNLNVTLFGGANAGGVFGIFNNSGNYTINGGTSREFVTCTLSIGTVFGGLIGKYEAQANGEVKARNATLSVSNVEVISTGGDKALTYGGAIGIISGNSYVDIQNVIVSTSELPVENDQHSTSFGGLVGEMDSSLLNVGSIILNSNGNNIAAYQVKSRGGIVGFIEKGVIRLHGITDLTAQKITEAQYHTGQIVGNNNNGLVYATGTGNNGLTDGSGWTLKRYTGSDRNGSDIGNWGEVIRVDGSNLTEGNNGLLDFDSVNHKVSINVPAVGNQNNEQTASLGSTSDFAAYSLAFNLNSFSNYIDENGILLFTNKINPSQTQSITLSSDVNLAGTGILGIGRDDNSQTFKGSLNGGNHTITMDIGGKYGDGINEVSGNGSGQLYAQRDGNKYAHYSIGLFPKIENGSINSLNICGNIKSSVTNVNNNNETHIYVGGVVGYSSGSAKFDSVLVSAQIQVDEVGEHNIYGMQGGFIGLYNGSNTGSNTLEFTSCLLDTSAEITNTRNKDRNRVGGYVGKVAENTTLNVSSCIISGTITGNKSWTGGFGAEIANNTIITFENLEASAMSIVTVNQNAGLLGYRWYNTKVILNGNHENPAVEVKECNLETGDAYFGGLVYWATGYWNATAQNSIVFSNGTKPNTFTGKSDANNTSGLIIGRGTPIISNTTTSDALYLEVGTWGEGGSYVIKNNAVSLKLNGSTSISDSTYFDELVGITINKANTKNGNKGNDNAVVSLAIKNADRSPVKIDVNSSCNTYKGQLENFKNKNTRYYYNLDSYRCPNDSTGLSNISSSDLDSAEDVLVWSVSQYAAKDIREYFCLTLAENATINGIIDLTGYSYYPVTPLVPVTIGDSAQSTLIFGFEEINTQESGNKRLTDSEHQHYLMHHGLLYNTDRNVSVKNTYFKGTVGKEVIKESDKTYNSGALIFGDATGDTTQEPIRIELNNVSISGLCVNGIFKDTTTYAPLLINQITKGVKLKIDGLATGDGYTDDVYAATSLIGKVGSSDAMKLNLTFSNIALDSRINTSDNNFVWNNGETEKHKVEYHTYHTIFTRATLLESFQYASDCSGVYNFNSYDTKVTYGVEISNTATGRNPGEQYLYYDTDLYVWDGTGTTPGESTIVEFFSSTNYLRYVYQPETLSNSNNYHELDINLRIAHLSVGCGTYSDPYQITDGRQLIALADYLSNRRANKWVVRVYDNVLSSQRQDNSNYHTSNTQEGHTYYMCDGEGWYEASKVKDKFVKGNSVNNDTVKNIRAYLRNAYYQIQNDIEISRSTYMGIGGNTIDTAFSGVIIGKNIGDLGTPEYPKVFISSTISNATSFGGLIRYSQGSVVKNLTVSYAGGSIGNGTSQKAVSKAAITLTNTNGKPTSTNVCFFGGVVGYVIGGDTIIENVSVDYVDNNNTATIHIGDKFNDRMIPVGGYVGLVGGVVDKKSNFLEKTGGGVIFRGAFSNDFNSAQNKADDNTYFYCNPFIGRVLDGYACYETNSPNTVVGYTLNNTDKNYTIPDINPNEGGLSVIRKEDSSLTVTVDSAQGLWLLSSIVNSGASAMDSTGNYTEHDGTNTIDAYQVGKPRIGDYNKIGVALHESEKVLALADEGCWGGLSSSYRYSYLVQKYTTMNDDIYYAAMLTGKDSANAVNTIVNIEFSSEKINMGNYGNGFRGIGASYGFVKHDGIYQETNANCYQRVMRRSIYAKSIVGGINNSQETDSDGNTIFNMNMNQNVYLNESPRSDTSWSNHGVGLFTNLGIPADGCTVSNLEFTGTVQIRYYDNNGSILVNSDKIQGESGAGALIAKTLYNTSSVKLSVNHLRLTKLTVYGGANTGGAIGSINRNNVSLVINDVTATYVTVSSKFNKDGNVGGIVGYFAPQSGGSCTIGSADAQSLVTNLNVTIEGDASEFVASGGLIGKAEKRNIAIQNCTITGPNSITVSKAKQTGGLIGYAGGGGTIKDVNLYGMTISVSNGTEGTGGLVGQSQANVSGLSIENVAVGSVNYPVTVCNSGNYYTGGMVGYLNGGKNCTIKNSIVDGLYVLSNSGDTGGLVGRHSFSNGLNVSNMSLSDLIVVTKDANSCAGSITGYTSAANSLCGYNILLNSSKVGFNSSVSIDKIQEINVETKDNIGRWLGKQESNSVLKLVAVAVPDGTNLPNNDIGIINGGTSSVVYADYPADKTDWDGNNSNSPYVDVNPKIDVTLKSTTLKSTTLTGNGVGYITTTNTSTGEEGNEIVTTVRGDSIAETILKEAEVNDSNVSRRYQNVVDTNETNKTFSKYLNQSNDIYLTTYQTEEKQNGTTVSAEVDFPILVVNNIGTNRNVDSDLWNYIAALTNVSSGEIAKEQASEVSVGTYRWTENGFVKKDGEQSASVNNKVFSISKNAYDNQLSQFTLVDVTYGDPTGTNTNGFHLFVPILVKKVMYASFSAKFLAGTTYRADAYKPFPNGGSSYATAGFDEPVTVYFEYNYQHTADEWNIMLANGNDLQWAYEKKLDLAASPDKRLPVGTKLTLVDKRTGQYYTYTWQESDANNVHNFNLSSMIASDGTHFSPVNMGDMLGLSATSVSGGAYIQDKETGTIEIGESKYRLPNENETGNYNITVDASLIDSTTKYLKTPEAYYLTIEIPKQKDESVSVVNNQLRCSSWNLENQAAGAPLAYIKEKKLGANNVVTYVIYDGIQQLDFSILTSKNGNSTDTVMSDGDSIQVALTSTLKLTNSGKDNFFDYSPTELDHQFNINLKKYLKTESGDTVSDVLIGAEGARYTYTVTKADSKKLFSRNGTFNNSESMEKLTIDCGSENAREIVNYFKETPNGTLTFKVVITLPYPTIGSFFPGRNTGDEYSGISVAADTRVATATTQLPTTQNKKTIEDRTGEDVKKYYTQNPSEATLIYNTYDDDGTGDDTRKLGVNPSDTTNDLSRTIYTSAVYNYANVDPSILSNAHSIKYSMQLFQKQEDGSYGNALEKIDEYLPSVTEMGPADGQGIKTLKKVFTQDVTKSDTLNIQITPLTGDEFEAKEFTYSNYKVVLTAVLLDSGGNELAGTKASDYIVYTNARIYQRIIDTTN